MALAVMPFAYIAADNCIISGSTNRTFAARDLSTGWTRFDTGPKDTEFSSAWDELDSRHNTFDVTTGRNLLRERAGFIIIFS